MSKYSEYAYQTRVDTSSVKKSRISKVRAEFGSLALRAGAPENWQEAPQSHRGSEPLLRLRKSDLMAPFAHTFTQRVFHNDRQGPTQRPAFLM